jgi:peptide deformylase
VIRDLRGTLNTFRRQHGFGRGIAAPQIGESIRIVYIDHDYTGALINPRIVSRTTSTFGLWDDCFSFPDILVWLRRNRSITVSFQNEEGVHSTLKASGSLSELLQHEIDHLDGILSIDRARSTKDIILRSEKKLAGR